VEKHKEIIHCSYIAPAISNLCRGFVKSKYITLLGKHFCCEKQLHSQPLHWGNWVTEHSSGLRL